MNRDKNNQKITNVEDKSSNPYKRGRKKKNSFLVFLSYAIPFLIVNAIIFILVTSIPKFDILVGDPTSYSNVEVTIIKKSLFPLKSIEATFDDNKIELTKVNSKTYKVSINENGGLSIKLTNLNGMSKTKNEYIVAIDDNPPSIDVSIDNFAYNVSFSDESSGIDFNSLYAMNKKGKRIKPKTVDEKNDKAIFSRDEDLTEIYISDNTGNTSVAHISEENKTPEKNTTTNDKEENIEILNNKKDDTQKDTSKDKQNNSAKKHKDIFKK